MRTLIRGGWIVGYQNGRHAILREGVVVFEDERYSTIAADEVFLARGGKGRKRKDVIDKIAAAQILKSYLERREAGARP